MVARIFTPSRLLLEDMAAQAKPDLRCALPLKTIGTAAEDRINLSFTHTIRL